MTIRAVRDLIRFHWVLLLLAAIVGTTAGWGLSSLREAEYTASADVFVVVDARRDADDINQGATYARDEAQNFAEVATRALVLQPVLDDDELGLSLAQLQTKVSTSVPLNSSIISISAKDSSPSRAAEIANGVASSLTETISDLVPERDGRAQVEVQSVERASVPTNPSGPPVALLMLLGGLVALCLALSLLGVREFLRGKVRTPEQASALTHSPLIGAVFTHRGARRRPVVLTAPNSAHAEQYRQIRANLRALLIEPNHNVLVLTSSVPGEGRSTAAANIAASLAATGIKVCLVEADLHRPTLATAVGLEANLGLAELLTGHAELEDALQPWGTDGLQVLVAGSTPDNPSELLASREAEVLLTTIRDLFEVTIIDAPPVLPVADALTLARLAGGAIMVVSERTVRARDVRRAVERMALVGAPILGTIFTRSKKAPRSRVYNGYAGRSAGKTSDGSTDRSHQAAEISHRAPSPASPSTHVRGV